MRRRIHSTPVLLTALARTQAHHKRHDPVVPDQALEADIAGSEFRLRVEGRAGFGVEVVEVGPVVSVFRGGSAVHEGDVEGGLDAALLFQHRVPLAVFFGGVPEHCVEDGGEAGVWELHAEVFDFALFRFGCAVWLCVGTVRRFLAVLVATIVAAFDLVLQVNSVVVQRSFDARNLP